MTKMIEHGEYLIASHFPACIENYDYSGLEDSDIDQLTEWLDSLPDYACLEYGDTDNPDDGICEITGLYADVVTVKVYTFE